MKAYVFLVDDQGLVGFAPEGSAVADALDRWSSPDRRRVVARYWAAIEDGPADEIRLELAAGRGAAALSLLYGVAIDVAEMASVPPAMLPAGTRSDLR